MVVRETPACVSHADSVENTSRNGRPAEKPRNSSARTRGCAYMAIAPRQPRRADSIGMRKQRRWNAPGARPSLNDGREAAASPHDGRSEEHTSELQSLMRISYAVFCLEKQK